MVRLARSLALPSILALTACVPDESGYMVVAEARLSPLDGSGVHGKLLFGHGKGYPDFVDASPRSLVLPDTEARRIAVYDAGDCADRDGAAVLDPAPDRAGRPDGQLGAVRRRDDGVWFWQPATAADEPADGVYIFNAAIGELTAAPGRAGSMLGKIVGVREMRADLSPGAWHACGVITAADYEI